jgi:hypothetical protein
LSSSFFGLLPAICHIISSVVYTNTFNKAVPWSLVPFTPYLSNRLQ